MSTKRNTYQIKKGSYMALGMFLGLIIGMAMDNIAVGIVLGLSFGTALDKRYG
jgi:hypothetical protein